MHREQVRLKEGAGPVRAYLIALALIALLVGSLFQAAEATGIRLMKMFATLGILLFGIVGTLMVTRWQTRTGLGAVEQALKSMEPEGLITDWAFKDKARPDFLVVAPAGLVAVCVDETAQSVRPKKAASIIGRARARVQSSVRWLQDQMGNGADLEAVPEIPVEAFLVLTRRKAQAEDSVEGVTVVNPEELTERLEAFRTPVVLDEAFRVKLTRHYRQITGS